MNQRVPRLVSIEALYTQPSHGILNERKKDIPMYLPWSDSEVTALRRLTNTWAKTSHSVDQWPNNDITISVDASSINLITFAGRSVSTIPPRMNFWRVPSENDDINGWSARYERGYRMEFSA